MSSKSNRNSSIEVLRIVGIFLILLNHTLQIDQLPANSFPWSMLSYLLSHLGGLGDVIFFGITTYFLCKKPSGESVKDSLRRAWILERQLLCYSIALYIFTIIIKIQGYGFNVFDISELFSLGVRSFFPLSSKLWWYPAAYVVLLVVRPFLDGLLISLGQRCHGYIAAVLSVLFCVPIPSGVTNLGWTPALFIVQYIIFSYIVRYLSPSSALLKALFSCAAFIGISGPLFFGVFGVDVSGGYLNLPQSAPSMVMGFSLVMLAARSTVWSNQLVNRIASCVFAAYLIQTYPSVEQILIKGVGIIAERSGEMWGVRVGLQILIALSILFIALLADSCRQGLFSHTIDRKRGGLFDLLWNYLIKKVPEAKLLERPICNFV